MTDIGEELHKLLKLALDKSVEGRRNLTASLGDLFNESTTVLNERERALMSEILRKLVRECEMAVRRDLAERLSNADDPPHDLIVLLANDQIEVAQPILANCEVLRDMELVQIIRRRTHQHQLAIAMRRAVSEPVSDALVETGDENVIKALLENHDAKISQATMTYLAEESRRVDSYQEPLIKRHDLPADLAKRMYLWVSAALREHILENFQIDPTALDDQLETLAGAIAGDPAQHGDETGPKKPAEVLARHLVQADENTWHTMIQLLRQGEVPLFEAMFGELSGLSSERLHRVLYESGGEGLAIACSALEMPKTTFATIFLLSRRGEVGKRVTDPRTLSRALMIFDKINPQTAMEVLKGWRRNEEYQEAIERVAASSPPAKAD
jgi:uncharacterized protein (DUF2336 family)